MKNDMPRSISALYARIHFGKLIDVVRTGSRDYIVTRNNEPEIVLMSLSKYRSKVHPDLNIENIRPEVIVPALEV